MKRKKDKHKDPTLGIHDVVEGKDGFERMTAADADKECSTVGGFYGEECPVCSTRVLLHCSNCKIQVTACWCTKMEEVDAEVMAEAELALLSPEMRARVEENMRMNRARKGLEEHGFWLPGQHHA